MATTTNLWAVGMATLLNSGIIALVILLGMRAVNHTPPFLDPMNKFVIKEFPLLATLKPHASDGNSGGGANDSVEVNNGCNPKRDMNPLAPVQVPSLENPKLSIENKIAVSPDLKLPDSPEIVVIGIHSSANVTLMSGWSRQQGRDWFGRRRRGWARPGSEGARPWLRSGDLRAGTERRDSSIPIITPEAEFSDEARRQKYQGSCTISVVIDAQGDPQNARVVQPIGMGPG